MQTLCQDKQPIYGSLKILDLNRTSIFATHEWAPFRSILTQLLPCYSACYLPWLPARTISNGLLETRLGSTSQAWLAAS